METIIYMLRLNHSKHLSPPALQASQAKSAMKRVFFSPSEKKDFSPLSEIGLRATKKMCVGKEGYYHDVWREGYYHASSDLLRHFIHHKYWIEAFFSVSGKAHEYNMKTLTSIRKKTKRNVCRLPTVERVLARVAY